ncbi:MAG: hypothetical protein KDK70_25200, partial [Myxococcales bacterium]|nr:hypothetical protein [Myxococcales bacterium]
MTAYYFATRSTPDGLDPEAHRRATMADLVLAWVRAPRPHGHEASIAELEAVFLRMSSPLDPQERRRMLYEAKHHGGASPASIRERLRSWVETHGLDYQTGDPGAELVLEDEPTTD